MGGGIRAKEVEVCPPEYENYVPCYYNIMDTVERLGYGGRRHHKLPRKKEETTRHQAAPVLHWARWLSAQSHYKIAGTRAWHTHPSDYKRLEQLIHHKRIIYGGGGGSHPRCQTRGPAPTAKKHVRDLDFTKKIVIICFITGLGSYHYSYNQKEYSSHGSHADGKYGCRKAHPFTDHWEAKLIWFSSQLILQEVNLCLAEGNYANIIKHARL